MKHAFTRYKSWILSLIATISVLIFLYLKLTIKIEIFLGITGTLLTIFISVINFFQNNDRLFKELFKEFNERYDKYNDILASVTPANLTQKKKQKIVEYFNLCAEEFLWVQRGRIPDEVWINWRNGIIQNLENKVIYDVYEEEKGLCQYSYYGFFNEMDKILTGSRKTGKQITRHL